MGRHTMNSVEPKTGAGDSQKTIFFSLSLTLFCFLFSCFLVHASVSMGFLGGCVVYNVSHYSTVLFRWVRASGTPLFLVELCFFFPTLQHAYRTVSVPAKCLDCSGIWLLD